MHVAFGGSDVGGCGTLDLSTLDGSNGFAVTGIFVGDYSGISVSSAKDVNGDGFADLLVGALYADPNG
jgi:FG-GAP repeat